MRMPRETWVVVLGYAAAGCGHRGPPPHPVGEMRARATAKLDVIELVVSDPARAEQVRRLYLRMAALARQFDRARARSMLDARAAWQQHSGEEPPDHRLHTADLEMILAPPLEEGKALFERYTALMLEARHLLTESEFAKLNDVR
jgi:hypothetical protein